MLGARLELDVLWEGLDALASAARVQEIGLTPEEADERLAVLAVADRVTRPGPGLDDARERAALASKRVGHRRP